MYGSDPPRTHHRSPVLGGRSTGGFTLVELILVIVLVGILAGTVAVFVIPPFRAAVDLENRANLVDAADSALATIDREARNALPNSIRVHTSSGNAHLEFITTRTGGRYRRLPAPGGGSDPFVPARSADTFDVPGGLFDAGSVRTRAPGTLCADGAGDCVSVYNTGQPGFDAYSGQNIAAITSASANSLGYDRGAAGPAFATHSPTQRFFVVDDVVSYICDIGSGRLLRFPGYGLQSGTPSPGGGELLAENVAGCSFRYNPGTSTRRGLLTLRLDLEREGEDVFLIEQVQVMNAP